MAGVKRGGAVATAALLFLGALVAAGAAARAADAPTALTVTKQGYFTSKITGALPPVLVKEVPPSPVCIVLPQLCNSTVDGLKTALSLNDGVPLPDIPDYLVPQPVIPGELPVGMIGGATRYTSAVQFTPPTLAPHAQVNKFALVVPDGTLAFSIESPAFREGILTALSQYPVQQPEVIQTFVDDVTSQKTPLAAFDPTGIQACMVTSAWAAGESQDPATIPTSDCVVGGTGVHDAAAKTWTFDITGIAQAWADGKPNMGISLSPLGAQNVAYGDPDPSTNFILTLNPTLTASFDVGPPVQDVPLETPPSVGGESLDAGGGSDLGGAPSVSAPSGDLTLTPTQTGNAAGPTAKAKLAAHTAGTPWWVWLIVPFVLGGAAALSTALDAVPDLATRRTGALSRLTADLDHRSGT